MNPQCPSQLLSKYPKTGIYDDKLSGRQCLAGRAGEEEALGAADEGIATLVKAKESIGGTSNTDADRAFDEANRMTGFAQPERARGTKVEAIVAAIDFKGRGEASGPAGEIEK